MAERLRGFSLDNRTAYIELFGITLSGVRKPDQGLYWTDLSGWWGLPDLRGKTDLIPGEHGRFHRTQYLREGRVITLTGHILASSNRELQRVRERLETALSAGVGSMVVHTNTYGSWERVVEIDTLTIEPDHGKTHTKFTVDMLAPDPRRYSSVMEAKPSGNSLVVSNQGLIDMHPTLIVESGIETFSGVDILEVETGRRLILPPSAGFKFELILDSRGRRATSRGDVVTRYLTSRQWFTVSPGDSRTYRATFSSGSPSWRAEFFQGAW